MMILLWKL
ncbi:hypothetical protein LINGRAPRIM_LOCUS3335 [Linum grandiflorum]